MRTGFSDELEGLRLQVEVMALQVGEAVHGARQVLALGDPEVAEAIVGADDNIDQMQISLTETCYTMLAREAPVASDLRLVVSIIRVLHELERIGDLAIRVAKAVPHQSLVASQPALFEVLLRLADNVVERYEAVREGWSAASVEPLDALQNADPLEMFADPLANRVLELSGDDAVRVAVAAIGMGRSFDRIGDHTQIMASRLRYLVTGDTTFLADEVSW